MLTTCTLLDNTILLLILLLVFIIMAHLFFIFLVIKEALISILLTLILVHAGLMNVQVLILSISINWKRIRYLWQLNVSYCINMYIYTVCLHVYYRYTCAYLDHIPHACHMHACNKHVW